MYLNYRYKDFHSIMSDYERGFGEIDTVKELRKKDVAFFDYDGNPIDLDENQDVLCQYSNCTYYLVDYDEQGNIIGLESGFYCYDYNPMEETK